MIVLRGWFDANRTWLSARRTLLRISILYSVSREAKFEAKLVVNSLDNLAVKGDKFNKLMFDIFR